jgi:hypothetical protein
VGFVEFAIVAHSLDISGALVLMPFYDLPSHDFVWSRWALEAVSLLIPLSL